MQTADTLPMDLVFRGLIQRMTVFRKDLEAAGVAYVDAKGEYADFHSLRKTFGTMLTLAGVPQRVVMELMRHSDMRLTAKTYTDAGMLPTGDAVMMLPALTTGGESDSQIDSQKLVASGLLLSRPVQVLETANVAETLINRGFDADLSLVVPVCPKGEMVRDAGFEPALPLLNIRHLRKLTHPIAHPARKRALGLNLAR
jgi:hypothetical protein